jgi:hypothetical protein
VNRGIGFIALSACLCAGQVSADAAPSAKESLNQRMRESRKAAERITAGRVHITVVRTSSKALKRDQLNGRIPPELVDSTEEMTIDCWFNAGNDQWRINVPPVSWDSRLKDGFRWYWDGDKLACTTWDRKVVLKGKSSDKKLFDDFAERGVVFNVCTLPFGPGESICGMSYDGRTTWWTPQASYTVSPEHKVERLEEDGVSGYRVFENDVKTSQFLIDYYFFEGEDVLPKTKRLSWQFPDGTQRVNLRHDGEWGNVNKVNVPTRALFYYSAAQGADVSAHTLDLTLSWLEVNKRIARDVFDVDRVDDDAPRALFDYDFESKQYKEAAGSEMAARQAKFEERVRELSASSARKWLWGVAAIGLAILVGWVWRRRSN